MTDKPVTWYGMTVPSENVIWCDPWHAFIIYRLHQIGRYDLEFVYYWGA